LFLPRAAHLGRRGERRSHHDRLARRCAAGRRDLDAQYPRQIARGDRARAVRNRLRGEGERMTAQRVCFTMQLKRDRIDDYLRAHDRVRPAMLEALTETGWTNYSLFIRRDDGLIVAYLETDDFDRANSEMSRREVN